MSDGTRKELFFKRATKAALINIERMYQNSKEGYKEEDQALKKIEDLLLQVTKPARYVNGEWNAVHKDWKDVDTKVVFAFPDVYEVGMSHLGFKILYHILNEREGVVAERAFSPWVDLEEKMREENIPLFSLESKAPLGDFDIIAFTLQYEMSYTNILNILDLAGISLLSRDRKEQDPLVIAGGPGAFSPEPIADFVDAFVIGDGEEIIVELVELYQKSKKENQGKTEFLKELALIPGIYVPDFYQVDYREDGTIKEMYPKNSVYPFPINRRVVKDLDQVPYPDKFIVPNTEVVHDRVTLEVQRGCSRGCRFCQAGIIYRPVRERSPKKLEDLAQRLLESTGYNEISLSSLSTSDYSCLPQLVDSFLDKYKEKRIGISLPSLRIDSFSVDLAQKVQEVRKTGLTFAPEAGTQRLRDVINKGVTEEDLLLAAQSAFSAGWLKLKLYFMIGLPTETDEDLDGIVELAKKVAHLGERIRKEKNIKVPVRITVSASSFVPKPHTPFQWEGQVPLEELERRQKYLREKLRSKNITFNWHEAQLSFLEAVVAKGDRKIGKVIERAWQLGCKFDSWNEHFRYDKWLEAFNDIGIDPEFYAYRKIDYQEFLPWDHVNTGVSKKYLIKEHTKALAGQLTGDCRISTQCTGCGICPEFEVEVNLAGRRNHAETKD